MAKYEDSFQISVDGEETGEKWIGVFKVKTKLSQRDYLRRDQVRRELLGPQTGDPGALAKDLSVIFSELAVRVVESPTWWKAAENGLSLEDTNVAVEVYTQALAAEQKLRKAVIEQAETAANELK